MPDLETRLSRRELLKGIVAAVPVLSNIANMLSSNDEVTYQQALADKENKKGLRQKYLKQLVRNSPYSRFITNVIYDHNREYAPLETSDIPKIKKNPRLIWEIINEYLYTHDSSYQGKSSESKAELRKKFMQSEDNRSNFEQYLKERASRAVTYLSDKFAIVSCNDSGFGTHLGSTLYVFGRVFQDITMDGAKGSLNVPPSEKYLKAILEHEFAHAEDNYNGINLQWFKADRNNYLDVHPEILDLVKEARGFLRQFDTIKHYELTEPSRLLSNDIFSLPPDYFQSVYSLATYLSIKSDFLDPKKLSFVDSMIVSNVLGDIRKRIPEIAIIPRSRKFFENFKAM